MIWSLIVGAIIGAIAGAITNRGASMGWISNILAGLIGSAIGQGVLGHWGPSLAGMALIPSIIGAVVLVLIVSAVFGIRAKTAKTSE
ncbi:GlsB/YeaQ/YmgE family stress response membrane protein [Leuconostoc lactis]|uniref:GlsB/YeaQ/YmgE family stress response membrane protein n=1 Tax=Leuconostoc lactis TaxID=1246 RepID=UPI0011BBC77C|nr:GlsB/YeaQ/YmgE family stress response membrane protein [Leuconostoc lactis]QEA51560.1 GlsB/YeaQ/YmgE family stress response membrane protein [Leuconostoc lactis]